jgi:uncharacterized protein YfaA (DUF2138 family)
MGESSIEAPASQPDAQTKAESAVPKAARFWTRRKLAVVVAGVLGLSAAGYTIYVRSPFAGTLNVLDLPLDRPDVYIASTHLSALPADLVSAPGLRDILTRDFVDYYEEHPDRLAVAGTLKRLAFENKLEWQDRLIARLLDAPAQVALWRDGKGRLAYGAVVLEKTTATGVLATLARVGLPDAQLSRVSEIRSGGRTSTVYALKVSSQSTWAVVVGDDRIAIFTHSGLLLNGEGGVHHKVRDVAGELMAGPANSPWRKDFALPASGTKTPRHLIASKADYLAFGYQRFFEGVKALRVESGGQGTDWTLHASATRQAWSQWAGSTSGPQSLWRAMPRGAAFCAALPADLAALQAVANEGLKSARWLADVQPSAAVCWYASGGLYAPLLGLQFKPGTAGKHDADLALSLAEITATRTRNKDGSKPPVPQVRTTQPKGLANTMLWTRSVRNDFGYLDLPESDGGARGHLVSLARVRDTVLASVDHRVLDQALAVAAKTFPSVDDDLARRAFGSPAGPVVVNASMPVLAAMLMTETRRLATPEQAPKFYRITQERLKPRVMALGGYGDIRLVLPSALVPAGGADPAVPVWQSLAFTSQSAK